MATLNATNLKHASSGSNNIVLAADGSVNIPTLTSNSTLGLVRQHKLLSKTSHSSTSSTSHVIIPDFSITITPTASDSIMIVEANMMYSVETHVITTRIYNGTTQLIQPVNFAANDHGNTSLYGYSHRMNQQHITSFETAGNTNARTYNVYWRVSGGTAYINRYHGSNSYNSVSILRVTEVAP